MAAYASGMTQAKAIKAKKQEYKAGRIKPKKKGLKPAKDIKVAGVPF